MALSAVGLNLLALVVVVHSMWKLVMDFGMTVTGHSLGDLALVITLLVGTTLSVAALKRCSGVDSESMCKYCGREHGTDIVLSDLDCIRQRFTGDSVAGFRRVLVSGRETGRT